MKLGQPMKKDRPARFMIANPRTDRVLAGAAWRADTFMSRLIGLLRTKRFESGAGLLIVPCNSVHCFGMKFPIDVIFISADAEVLHLIPDMAPWRASRIIKGSKAAIELPAGTIRSSETRLGDRLVIETPW